MWNILICTVEYQVHSLAGCCYGNKVLQHLQKFAMVLLITGKVIASFVTN